MKHSPETGVFFAFTCYDPRFRAFVDRYIDEHYTDDAKLDATRFPGGVANKAALREALATAIKLHQPTHAMLSIHEDCGYGAKLEDLQDAASLARELGITQIELVYFKLDGTYEVVAEEHANAANA